jgi:tetratricopeptide (TPR) repeat protein
MLQSNRFAKCLLIVLSVVSTETVVSQTEDAKLAQLRQQLALNYLNPTPHLTLAKYYWQKGDRLSAFYISEYARRARFPEAIFNQAFQISFGGATRSGVGKQIGGTWLDDSKIDGQTQSTDNQQAATLFDKAAELQKQGKLAQAEETFIKAAALAPDSVHIQSWVGRFFFKVKADNRRALDYY